MILHRGYRNLNLRSPVVTVGIFDGVHSGHRIILDRLAEIARTTSGESVVLTFDPLPSEVLYGSPEKGTMLTTMDEKFSLIEKASVDHIIVARFTKKLSATGPSDFISKILVDKIGAKHLIMGYDNNFGRHKKGDFDTISRFSESYDLKVWKAGKKTIDGVAVSSSSIREALYKGRIEEANLWLGYNYSLTGTIVEGRRIGRTFGFPTANIKPSDSRKLIPGDGVYAAEARIGGDLFPGMLSIGFNPTVNKVTAMRSIEVHLFDFAGELYGREITVVFRYRLRDEKKFMSTEQLAAQMKMDREKALELLS